MDSAKHDLRRERWKLTARLVRTLERPMLFLSFVWTVLLIVEFTSGLSPRLQVMNDVIWAGFVAQFGVEFLAASQKRVYLRKRWVTALSLALPAFRLLRLVRVWRGLPEPRVAFGWLVCWARSTVACDLLRSASAIAGLDISLC